MRRGYAELTVFAEDYAMEQVDKPVVGATKITMGMMQDAHVLAVETDDFVVVCPLTAEIMTALAADLTERSKSDGCKDYAKP